MEWACVPALLLQSLIEPEIEWIGVVVTAGRGKIALAEFTEPHWAIVLEMAWAKHHVLVLSQHVCMC